MTSSTAYPVLKGTLVSSENHTWNTADSLGKGASAVVYLGRHKADGKYVAVKVFHDQVYQRYKTSDLRELDLLRQLKHPNVIELLAVEKLQPSSSRVVLIMEYCEGGSLHHMLDQPQYYYGLSEEEYLLVLDHVCSGMEYLQKQCVIHRDIKPGNIMRAISSDGFSIYKLTDFGAARNLYEDESFQSLYGTEEYLHPGMYERAVLKLPNSQTFDAKVDLWSLGVTFYHTATGELPFKPYGGRSNRRTMFEIITQKESGVISGVQKTENGPIEWKRELPESSPLSGGLKTIVIPVLAGLMEPDTSRMLSYQALFRIVHDIRQKVMVKVFYFNKGEELVIYAEQNIALSGLQDQIASMTDIVASDQVLIVGGRTLEEVVDPMCCLKDYPAHLREGSIYLFQREITDVHKIAIPDIPNMPEFLLGDFDADAGLAHKYSAWGELVKRNQQTVVKQQEKLINGLLFLRVYVEGRLVATKTSHQYVQQLLTECKGHIGTLFELLELLRDVEAVTKPGHQEEVATMSILLEPEIRRAHDTASQRMVEIGNYIDMLLQKMEEIKAYTSKFAAVCQQEKCARKVEHHVSVVTGIFTRMRRDRSLKNQMTAHDQEIHRFEVHKLHERCVTLQSIFNHHCLLHLGMVYKNSVQVCESLTKCLYRVVKVEKNIAVVKKCMDMIITKLQQVKESVNRPGSITDVAGAAAEVGVSETGPSYSAAVSSEMLLLSSRGDSVRGAEASPQGLVSTSDSLEKLKEKLDLVTDILDENSRILFRSLEETAHQDSSSFRSVFQALPELDGDNT